MARFSISSLIGIVALTGLALGCLLYASSPWAAVAIVAYYAALGTAPLGIMYRREGRRAFYVGFTIWIWGYLVLTAIPGDAQWITAVLDWSYPKVITESRQGDLSLFVVIDVPTPTPTTVDGKQLADLGNTVDLRVDDAVIMEGITTVTDSNPGPAPTLRLFMHRNDARDLRAIMLSGKKVGFSRHRGSVPSKVDRASFDRIGKAVLGLLAGIVGGLVGRWFYGTLVSSEAPV